jgi:hypothetical protein
VAVAENRQHRDHLLERAGQVEDEVIVAERLVLNEIDSQLQLNDQGIAGGDHRLS